jgi:hypothetical protein
MTKLNRAVEAHVDDFTTVELANVFWAYGRLDVHPGEPVVRRLSERALSALPDFTPQVRWCLPVHGFTAAWPVVFVAVRFWLRPGTASRIKKRCRMQCVSNALAAACNVCLVQYVS